MILKNTLLKQMERALIKLLRKKLGKNLVSLLAVGSYGSDDYINGYSDYDVMALVSGAVKIPDAELNKTSNVTLCLMQILKIE